eukprot:scaffold2018_cov113-Cylindrotheca_fusiformis.AAC.9
MAGLLGFITSSSVLGSKEVPSAIGIDHGNALLDILDQICVHHLSVLTLYKQEGGKVLLVF